MVNFTKKAVIDQLLGRYEGDAENDFLAICFSSDEMAEKYESIREDLIESYLRNDLSHESKKRFESHFLKDPHHRELFEFAKTLRIGLKESAYAEIGQLQGLEKKQSLFANWMIPAVAFGVLLVVGVMAWQFAFSGSDQQVAEIGPVPSEEFTPTPDISSPAKIPPTTPVSTPTPVEPRNKNLVNAILAYSLPLMPKGGGAEVLKIKNETKVVELSTPKPKLSFSQYHVEIQDEERVALFKKDFKEFTIKGNNIVIPVPADNFKSGKLRFIIFGKHTDGTSTELKGTERFFQVEKSLN